MGTPCGGRGRRRQASNTSREEGGRPRAPRVVLWTSSGAVGSAVRRYAEDGYNARMTEARLQNSNTKVLKSDRTSFLDGRKGPEPETVYRLLNLRQANQEFGLSDYHIYRAVHAGLLHAVQVGGKGRIYYAEWELKTLADRVSNRGLLYVGAA